MGIMRACGACRRVVFCPNNMLHFLCDSARVARYIERMEQQPQPIKPTPRLSRQHVVLVVIAVALIGGGVALTSDSSNAPNEALPQSAAAPITPAAPVQAPAASLPSSEALAAAYGGPASNRDQQALVARVGQQLVKGSDAAKSVSALRFVLLADTNRINLFTMPDGSIFITTLLFNHMKTEGQLAAMLSHGLAQLALKQSPQGLANGSVGFDSTQEQAADALGVKFMAQAGYDPNAYLTVLMHLRDIHAQTPVEFFTTHPSPINRVAHIEYAIDQQFPEGVPESLSD